MSINISEVIWTVICFFALFFVLKKLFFDPMIRFLDQRQARLDAAAEEQRRAREELAQAREAAEETLSRRGQENRELLKQRKAEDAQAREAALRQARQDAAQLLEDARERVGREEEQAQTQTDAQLDELAGLLVGQMSDLEKSAVGAREREQV